MWQPEEQTPGLAMSRAFGDYCIKEYGLVSVPEVTQRHISIRDQFVILATDGVKPIEEAQKNNIFLYFVCFVINTSFLGL